MFIWACFKNWSYLMLSFAQVVVAPKEVGFVTLITHGLKFDLGKHMHLISQVISISFS